MGSQKPLIVPWLVEQLDAQRYPRVAWLNPERTLFRVPWKHGSRQSVSPEDFQLFEDWAIARGRYCQGTDPRTPSEWKRNFRSALNRKDGINMIQDNSTDSEDPHKIFEIQPTANLNACAQEAANTVVSNISPISTGSMDLRRDNSSSGQGDTLESVLSTLDLCGPMEENPASSGGLPSSSLDLALSTIEVPQLQEILATSEFDLPLGEGNPVSSELNLVPPISTLTPLYHHILGTDTFESDFEVQVYYRGRLVFADAFKNVQGLCFVPPGSPGHYPDLADVVLPDPVCLSDKLQASYTHRLLRGVAPGVLLRIEGMSLCGMRRGHCHVSWSHSETLEDEMPHGQLLKEQFSSIYNLQQFVQELIGYMEERNGSPNYSLWLCFGEDWPDTVRPWKKKLIMVKVIPKVLEALHDLSQTYGASSLKGAEPDLRISDSLQESFLDQLRGWSEKMEVQFS